MALQMHFTDYLLKDNYFDINWLWLLWQWWEQSAILNQENMSIHSKIEKSNF